MKTGNPLFNHLPERLRWSVHNVLAHPFAEVLFWLGLEGWSNVVHDWTIPEHETGEGRG